MTSRKRGRVEARAGEGVFQWRHLGFNLAYCSIMSDAAKAGLIQALLMNRSSFVAPPLGGGGGRTAKTVLQTMALNAKAAQQRTHSKTLRAIPGPTAMFAQTNALE